MKQAVASGERPTCHVWRSLAKELGIHKPTARFLTAGGENHFGAAYCLIICPCTASRAPPALLLDYCWVQMAGQLTPSRRGGMRPRQRGTRLPRAGKRINQGVYSPSAIFDDTVIALACSPGGAAVVPGCTITGLLRNMINAAGGDTDHSIPRNRHRLWAPTTIRSAGYRRHRSRRDHREAIHRVFVAPALAYISPVAPINLGLVFRRSWKA